MKNHLWLCARNKDDDELAYYFTTPYFVSIDADEYSDDISTTHTSLYKFSYLGKMKYFRDSITFAFDDVEVREMSWDEVSTMMDKFASEGKIKSDIDWFEWKSKWISSQIIVNDYLVDSIYDDFMKELNGESIKRIIRDYLKYYKLNPEMIEKHIPSKCVSRCHDFAMDLNKVILEYIK